MGHSQILRRNWKYFLKCAAMAAAFLLFGPAGQAQSTQGPQQAQQELSKYLNEHPGLLAEFGRLVERFQHEVQFPAPRAESRLLPLLPQATLAYAAFPNYGEVVNQTLKLFRQEREQSAALRDWWSQGEMAKNGPKLEDGLEKLYQLDQYLGDEIAASVEMVGKEPQLLIVAEVKKPGLKKFLQEMLEQLADKSKPGVRVLDVQELAMAKERNPGQELVVLVRPDYVAGAFNVATLRRFHARMERGSREFASTPFGQRITQEYKGGVTVLAAGDVHKMLDQLPPADRQNATFQQSGFADMQYAVWAHKDVGGQGVSQSELSFSGPRRGSAAWLAKPQPLGSLDFVSPKALMAASFVLKNPAEIFEDTKALASNSNSNPFAAVEVFEQALKLSLKDDLLGLLGGELTLELDSVAPPQPTWRAMLAVKDANHIQQTLNTLLAAAKFESQSAEDGGVSYQTVLIPNGKTTVKIGYAFVDGYWIVGSSQEVVADAVRLHQSGAALGKSKKFLAAMLPGHAPEASALLYEDPMSMAALQLRQVSPEMAESLAKNPIEISPAVVCLYGEDNSIKEASVSPAFDAGAVLVVAAIAIPNLLRSRMAANEASAVGSVRTVNTAEVTYEASYPQRGFAPNLATLGPDPRKLNAYSEEHAALIDASLGNVSCTAEAWCTKSGYRFKLKAICAQGKCGEYVVVATPVDSNTGTRSFCSTSNGVIRFRLGPPLAAPLSVSQCKAWPPIQ
ncbi:MAG TPA: hypothetical protein VEI73_11975 [Candidatus Acidoferrum sp.]|nr:hypothetical protein [Candidatus Acidoferrum sp.]